VSRRVGGGGFCCFVGGGWGGGGGGGGAGGGGNGGGGGSSGGGGGIGGSIPNGESLGIPTGLNVKFPGLWETLLPIDAGCEFGPCTPGGSFSAGTITWGEIGAIGWTVGKYVRAASLVGIIATVITWTGDAPPPTDKKCTLSAERLNRDGSKTCSYSCPSGRPKFVWVADRRAQCPNPIPDWAP